MEKSIEAFEQEVHRANDQHTKTDDKFVAEVDRDGKEKEAELLET